MTYRYRNDTQPIAVRKTKPVESGNSKYFRSFTYGIIMLELPKLVETSETARQKKEKCCLNSSLSPRHFYEIKVFGNGSIFDS